MVRVLAARNAPAARRRRTLTLLHRLGAHREGTVCYRPVPATRTDDGTYILGGQYLYDPEDEVWEFAPGTRVYVEKRLLSGGMKMVATAFAR
jgi:hypothetical protein